MLEEFFDKNFLTSKFQAQDCSQVKFRSYTYLQTTSYTLIVQYNSKIWILLIPAFKILCQ
jgi:hypothetical protein